MSVSSATPLLRRSCARVVSSFAGGPARLAACPRRFNHQRPPSDKPSAGKTPQEDVERPSRASDPYPLPFDPRLEGLSLASEHQSHGLPSGESPDGQDLPLRVPGREPGTETREQLLARLVYQTRKRGTLETDLILSTFAAERLRELPDEFLLEFDLLLDEPDWDIFYWLTQRKPVPPRWQASFDTPGRLGHILRQHTRNERKEVRRMPALTRP